MGYSNYINYILNFYKDHKVKPASEFDCFQITMILFSGHLDLDTAKQIAKLTYQTYQEQKSKKIKK